MKKELGIFLLLVAMCVYAAFDPASNFLSANNIFNQLRSISMYGIFSIGLGLVIITGGIDLSVGSLFVLVAITLSIGLKEWQLHWTIASLIVLAGASLVGGLHGFLITRVRMQPFIVTLCGMLIYRSLARFIVHDETRGFKSDSLGFLKPLVVERLRIPMPEFAQKVLGGENLQIPYTFFLLIFVAVIAWFLLHKSVYGRYLMAVGRNEDAARYSGINDKRMIASAYVLCGLLAGVSGILFAVDTGSIGSNDFGAGFELYGIAAAVLGGCSLRGGEGSILGIVLGAAVIQVLNNLVNLLGVPSTLNNTVIGSVIFLGVLVDQIVKERSKRRVKV